MLRESTRQAAYRRMLVDILLTIITFVGAHQLRSYLFPWLFPGAFQGGLFPLSWYLPVLAVTLVLWTSLLLPSRLTHSGKPISLRLEIVRELRAVLVGVMLLASFAYLFRLDFVSRPFLILFGLSNAFCLALARYAERRTAFGRLVMEAQERVVVVVGTGPEGISMAKTIHAHANSGFKLLGIVGIGAKSGDEIEGFPVLGTPRDLPALLNREVVDEVVLAVPTRQLAGLESLLIHCQELGVRVRVALRPFPHLQPHIEVESLNGAPLLTFANMPTAAFSLFVKRLTDTVVAVIGLIAAIPLWLVVALAIKLDSRGPMLFRQVRSGLRGRKFILIKFRTMVEGAESMKDEVSHLNMMDGPAFKAHKDPRVTRVGRFLRRSSLDEVPQLINVLRGDMSLVGPRPPLPEEVDKYEPWQRRRLSMKPGITCLWQVSGRAELDFATWMELDLAYIDNWSLWLDLKIVARTIPAVFSGKGAA